MNAGIGLIVMAAIFAFGVALFGLVAIALLPGATFVDELVARWRSRRSAPSADASPSDA